MWNPMTANVTRPTWTIDNMNNRTPVWPEAPTHTVDGCAFAPSSSEATEVNTAGRMGNREGGNLFAPLGADIEPADRIEAGGSMYRVLSFPARWESRFGSLSGTVATLERIEG